MGEDAEQAPACVRHDGAKGDALDPAVGAEEVPATVVKDSEPAPSGLLHSTFVSAAQPFMLALKEPGHPLLPAPKALSGVVAVGENLAALGEKFYASGIVGKSGGVLVEIDPKTGATRALKAPGVKIADVAPAGDKLVVAYTRARDQLIGVYDVAAEAFTVEVTLPAEPREQACCLLCAYYDKGG